METPVDLLGYLASHKIEPRMIVIEYNGEIIKRDRWEGITLQDGDKLEIVHMVAGAKVRASFEIHISHTKSRVYDV